jgi:hypothetical protein
MKKVQFPKYQSGEISDAVNVDDISQEKLPDPIKFDLARWKDSFAHKCDEQLRNIQTPQGSFIEARLK